MITVGAIFASAALVVQSVPSISAWIRPAECEALDARPRNVWERVKRSRTQGFCDRLAAAAAQLVDPRGSAEEALRLANAAETLMPGHPTSSVFRGRALSLLHRDGEAIDALREAEQRDPRALDEPHALLVLARSLGRTHEIAQALETYRKVLPRIASMHPLERAIACAEAGVVALLAGDTGKSEVAVFFQQATREQEDTRMRIAPIATAFGCDPLRALEAWDLSMEGNFRAR